MIFQPSRQEVRHFFIAAWQRHCKGLPLAPIEHLAADWISLHPEYHPLLNDAGEALERDFTVEDGQVNPFLHLSMHLSLEEQYSIDQPAGVRGCIDIRADTMPCMMPWNAWARCCMRPSSRASHRMPAATLSA
jgi:hypothetical protein